MDGGKKTKNEIPTELSISIFKVPDLLQIQKIQLHNVPSKYIKCFCQCFRRQKLAMILLYHLSILFYIFSFGLLGVSMLVGATPTIFLNVYRGIF